MSATTTSNSSKVVTQGSSGAQQDVAYFELELGSQDDAISPMASYNHLAEGTKSLSLAPGRKKARAAVYGIAIVSLCTMSVYLAMTLG